MTGKTDNGKVQINWKRVSAISQPFNVQGDKLEDLLDMLAWCDIQDEALTSDPNYVKLFQLSQSALRYLLEYRQQDPFVKEDLENRLAALSKEMELKESTIKSLSKENRNLKKTLFAYQLMAKVPGGISQSKQPVAVGYHHCSVCSKVFNSEYYLDSHLKRRHPDYTSRSKEHQSQQQTSTHQANSEQEMVDRLTMTIERFSMKVMETERQLRAEMETKFQSEVQKKEQRIEELMRLERLAYEREIQELKSLLINQVGAVQKIDQTVPVVQPVSNLGRMEDDDSEYEELVKKMDEKYQKSFEHLEKVLQEELIRIRQTVQQAPVQHQSSSGLSASRHSVVGGMAAAADLLMKTTSPNRSYFTAAPSPESPLQKQPSAISNLATVSLPSLSPDESKQWATYVKLMEDVQAKSYDANKLERVKSDVISQLDKELAKRGIDVLQLGNQDYADGVLNGIRSQQLHFDATNGLLFNMRDYLSVKIDGSVPKSSMIQSVPPSPAKQVARTEQKLKLSILDDLESISDLSDEEDMPEEDDHEKKQPRLMAVFSKAFDAFKKNSQPGTPKAVSPVTEEPNNNTLPLVEKTAPAIEKSNDSLMKDTDLEVSDLSEDDKEEAMKHKTPELPPSVRRKRSEGHVDAAEVTAIMKDIQKSVASNSVRVVIDDDLDINLDD